MKLIKKKKKEKKSQYTVTSVAIDSVSGAEDSCCRIYTRNHRTCFNSNPWWHWRGSATSGWQPVKRTHGVI